MWEYKQGQLGSTGGSVGGISNGLEWEHGDGEVGRLEQFRKQNGRFG